MKGIPARSDSCKEVASDNCKEVASVNCKEVASVNSMKTRNADPSLTLIEEINIILLGTYKSVRLDLNFIAEVHPRKMWLACKGLRSDSLQGPKDGGSLDCTTLLDKVVDMKSGFYSATTIVSDLQIAPHFSIGRGFLSEIEPLDPHHIYLFHLNPIEDTSREAYTDAARLLPWLGVVPLDDICAHLKGIGNDSPCFIEPFCPRLGLGTPYN
jgi:hypothetical protein